MLAGRIALIALALGWAPLAFPAAPSAEPEVSAARAAFYRRAFPDATAFVVKRVPEDLVPFEDRGNLTYLEVKGAGEVRLGYLRDFSGPVTSSAVCPCHPLSLTLAFDPSLALLTILSEAPLEKLGHAPLTAEELARLIALAKAPPASLSAAAKAEDLLDAVTGATRTEFKDAVVSQAALTTRRVASLVKDSVRLIQGVALSRDQQALREILSSGRDPMAMAGRVAGMIPQAESPEVLSKAYQAMASFYAQALERGAPRHGIVEKRLLEAAERRPEDLAQSCQALATRGVALDFVEECIQRLEPKAAAIAPALWQLLRGTTAFEEGRAADALPALRIAAASASPADDPLLHLRLVQALSATGHKEEACEKVKPLFRDKPRLPGVEASLSLCPGPREALAAGLREERHRAVAGEIRREDVKLPVLSLLDEEGRPVERDLAKEAQPTVLIFFATWCPHCQQSFPEWRAFAADLAQDPLLRDKVRVVAVRSYTERETEPYSAFVQRLAPNFTIWRDGPAAVSLKRIATAYGLSPGVPRLLVVDAKGMLRFEVAADPHRETARELRWAAEAVANLGR